MKKQFKFVKNWVLGKKNSKKKNNIFVDKIWKKNTFGIFP